MKKYRFLKYTESTTERANTVNSARDFNHTMLNPSTAATIVTRAFNTLPTMVAKLRMYIKPIGEYPYNLEQIIEVELREIDDKHYKEG